MTAAAFIRGATLERSDGPEQLPFAMGGSNQSLFLIAALFVGLGNIPGQGSAAVVLLIVGLLLGWAAAPARTELMARHQEIEHLAHHDPLTNLPNRTALARRLTATLNHAKASRTSFAVLSIDLDHFKEANDVFGHGVGDELLCAISRRLEEASAGAFIARAGGDEFTLVSAVGEQTRDSPGAGRRGVQIGDGRIRDQRAANLDWA